MSISKFENRGRALGVSFSVFWNALADIDFVPIGDAVHDGGQTQEAGGPRRLAGSWKQKGHKQLCVILCCFVCICSLMAVGEGGSRDAPSLWLISAAVEWSAEVGQVSEDFFQWYSWAATCYNTRVTRTCVRSVHIKLAVAGKKVCGIGHWQG